MQGRSPTPPSVRQGGVSFLAPVIPLASVMNRLHQAASMCDLELFHAILLFFNIFVFFLNDISVHNKNFNFSITLIISLSSVPVAVVHISVVPAGLSGGLATSCLMHRRLLPIRVVRGAGRERRGEWQVFRCLFLGQRGETSACW